MGIVIKQGFYNSFWMAVGIVIGYVNTILLFPVFLTADQFGLTRVLWAASSVFAQFALLGSPQILIKYFPDFGKKTKERGGFFALMLLISFIGFMIFIGLTFLFKGKIISSYAAQSSLFANNYNYIFVFTFFFMYFTVLEAYLRALFKTTVAGFLKNVVLRVFWLALVLLYYKKTIGFETFIFWFVFAYGIILLLLIVYSIKLKELAFSFNTQFLSKKEMKSMLNFGLFVILGGSTAYLASYIDILMVGGMINLKNVAFYSVAFYLGTVIMLPYNGASNILIPIISKGYAENNLSKIKEVYQQASVNLSLAGMLIFLGIWLNADNIFKILPPEYAAGKYVLLLIALTKLFSSAIGINGFILQFSPHYRILLISNIAFLIFVVVSNYLLIPLMGIEGAALATLLSQVFVNTLQITFIYHKMRMLPFKIENLKVFILGSLVFLIVSFIPEQKNLITDLILRSFVIVLIYLPLAYFWKISDEYTDLVNKWIGKVF